MKVIPFLIVGLLLNIIFVSAQTANWTPVLPGLIPLHAGWIPGISRVSQMKFHPTDPKKMYAISARGGLFISIDTGNSWTIARGCDFLPYVELASVCIDHTNDQVIYLGTGDDDYGHTGLGVWKTSDGGQSFFQTGLTGKLVREMIMDPNDHTIIVAVTDQGIYKTIDAGNTWSLKLNSTRLEDLKQKTPVSRVLYAASRDSAFYRSTDFGESWTQILNTIVLPAGVAYGQGGRIAVTPADTNVVYLGFVANGGFIYKSTDGGSSFSIKKTAGSPYLTYYSNSSSSWGQGDYNFAIGTDRLNANILYLVAHRVWKSIDGGVTWTDLQSLTNQSTHTDLHQVTTSPYNNNKLWNTNDGGVFLSNNGGLDWAPKSAGIYGIEIYQGVCSPTRKETIVFGTQDNGAMYSTASNWIINSGGDITTKWLFDYRPNSDMVYAFDGNTRKSLNTGTSTNYLPAGLTRFHSITFNRMNPDLAFVTDDTMVYRTTNLTATTPTWTAIMHTPYDVYTLNSSLADPNRLYVATSAKLYYVANALAATPTYTVTDLPGDFLSSDITTFKNSPNTLYASCYYVGNKEIYRSDDNGLTWVNNTFNLVPEPVCQIITDEYSSNQLTFISSRNKIYYKVGNATSWTLYNDNLPTRTDIKDMSIYNDGTSNTRLRVAVYGRGIWETPIDNLRALHAALEVDNTNPCLGEAVHFSDISTGHIISRTWTFPGGIPATSIAEFPVVSYNTRGNFDVTLTISDGITNSTKTKSVYISTNGTTLPVVEGFEGADELPDRWKNFDNATQGYKWRKTDYMGGYNAVGHSMVFRNYISASSLNITGEKDELQVKRLDFSAYDSAKLSFDIYYDNYIDTYRDSLAVLISTDCGQTFNKIYQKGGAMLSSYSTPSHWRTDTINIDSYTGFQDVVIRFQNISRNDGSIYIDNVNITGAFRPPVTYIFTGNGNWDVEANWQDHLIPPAILPANQQIIIDPIVTGECVLNVTQQITNNSSLIVRPGKKFRIYGNLNVNN